MTATPDSFDKKSMLFENGQSAEFLHVRRTLDTTELWKALNIPESQAAILVGGSAEVTNPRLKNRLTDLMSRGVAQAASEWNAG